MKELVTMNKLYPPSEREPTIDCEFPCKVKVKAGYRLNLRTVPNNLGPIKKLVTPSEELTATRVLQSDDTRWCRVVGKFGDSGYVLSHYLEVAKDE